MSRLINIPPAGAGYASRLAPWCAAIIAGGILLSSLCFGQATLGGTGVIGGQGAMQVRHTVISLVSITVTPENVTSLIGQTTGYTATGHYSDSSTSNITSGVVWASSSPSTASLGALTATQAVTCLLPGSSTISATQASITGSTGITCGGSGGPLVYAARYDNCVDGSQTGCVAGTTTGLLGATLIFQERVGDPVPFAGTTINSGSCPSGLTPSSYPAYCPAPMNAMSFDPDFGSTLVIGSDDSLNNNATPWDTSWTEGSSGGPKFSQDEKLLLLAGSNGNLTLINLDPASIHAKTCATSPCVSKTGIFSVGGPTHGNSTHFAANASASSSGNPAELKTFYELDNNYPNILVNTLAVTSSITSPGTGTMVRTAYADFVNGSGGFGGVFPAIVVGACTVNYTVTWTGLFQTASDGTVGFAIGGGYDWCPSWTPADSIGNTTFIYPLTNNAAKHGFQATTISGATGASEPNWDSICSSTCTDGGVTWTNIGNLNGQGPGFDLVSFSASIGYSRLNTRLATIYRGSGNSAPAGHVKTNDPVACTRVLGVPCSGTPVDLPDEFTMHGATQSKNAAYLAFTPTGAEALNPPGNWNSGTLTCQPNGASDVWAGAWNSLTTYASKKTVAYTDTTSAYYVATTAGGNLNQPPRTGGVVNTTFWTQQEGYCAGYIWQIATNLVQPLTAWGQVGGHSGGGYINQYFGSRYAAASIANPSAQLSPPNGPITLNPGTTLLSAALPSDDHPSYNNTGALDLQPFFSALDDVPSWVSRYQVANGAGYDEIIAAANVTTGATARTWRFGHIFNTNNNRYFGVQDNIGTVSPQGDLFAVPTDLYGTRDAYNAGSTQCQNNRGMFAPRSGMTLNLNDTVYPSASNAGNYIYQTTVAGVTSGIPVWCQTVSCTIAWGSATVQNIGANTCRGDIMIVDLLSAHIAHNAALTWNWSGSGTPTYKVYRSLTSGGEVAPPIGTSATTNYTDTTVANGTTYYYKVTATVSGIESPMSNEVQAVIP